MQTIIDLSHVIHDNMESHPYDGIVRVYEDKTIDIDKYNNTRLETGMHAGTHIDAPRHLLHCKCTDFVIYNRYMGIPHR